MIASKKEVRECKEIHKRIDELIPRVYAQEIQNRLKNKGVSKSIARIQNARILRIKDLVIMRELEAWCKEVSLSEFN